MRIIQHGTDPDLVIAYLVGPHIDADLCRSLGPSPWIAAFANAHGQTPEAVARALGIKRVRSLVVVGYSAGCQAVRGALRSGVLPICDRLGVVAIDGTHASLPPETWQISTWNNLAEQARKGERLFVATCTAQTYVERLPKGGYLSTLSVLRQAIDSTLIPCDPPDERHEGELHVYAHASKTIDAAAHIAQQRTVLPELLAKHVRPWLERAEQPQPSRYFGLRALNIALSFVGQREEGGQNRGPIVRQALAGCTRLVEGKERPLDIREGVPWCAAFVGLCEATAALPGEAVPPWRAAVWELVRDAKEAGTWREVEGYEPRPGDLAVFKRNGKDPRAGSEGHVERVVLVEDGTVETIGGNVGDAVVQHRWRIGDLKPSEALVGWIARG